MATIKKIEEILIQKLIDYLSASELKGAKYKPKQQSSTKTSEPVNA